MRLPFSLLLTPALLAQAPLPVGPLPNTNQLAWHKLRTYAFIHFGPNTFTGREWGQGTEAELVFNPTDLDVRQWVNTFKAAGLKGVILTAKHHDGFCLWPSKTTAHTIAKSPYKGGKGDLVKELSQACQEAGLKFGVYISPWDRNHPKYGTEEYNDVYVSQLEELLGNYDELFELWWDGACGEGPNGKRQVYDWERFLEVARRLQPKAVIFSDAGDVRWVGNEEGFAYDPNWAMLRKEEIHPGTPRFEELKHGHKDGTAYTPAEVDVSIRQGWFWRKQEDATVKTPEQLEEIFYDSVGRGSSMNLNIPPDTRGRIPDQEAKNLKAWREKLDATFEVDLAQGAKATADGSRKGFEASKAVDGRDDTFWAAPAGQKATSLTLSFPKPVAFDRVWIEEGIEFGQRVSRFEIEARVEGRWMPITHGFTIGSQRILRVPPCQTDGVRLKVIDGRGAPVIRSLKLFASPDLPKALAAEAEKSHRMAWWRDARFGMFIHWGLYSIPAGTWEGKVYPGAAEWLQHWAKIPAAAWAPLKDHFNPEQYDPRAWAKAAKAAGMHYVVFTTKHHDGFCLWDTQLSDFKVTNTPFKRDVLRELVEAFRAEGLKIGLYHSILDWHHPDYLPKPSWEQTNEGTAPIRADHAPGQADAERTAPRPKEDFGRYITHLKGQLKELLTHYGPVDMLWFDGEWDGTWTHDRAVDLEAYIRGLKPDLIINNRIDKGRQGMGGFNASPMYRGDFATPEQEIPESGVYKQDWESCLTMNATWGFHASDKTWKRPEDLIKTLVDTASKGGNLLLNVGPDAFGTLQKPYLDRLDAFATWMSVNAESIQGTTANPFREAFEWGRLTRKGSRLYLHVFTPDACRISLPVALRDVKAAHLLADSSKKPLRVEAQEGGVGIYLPVAPRAEPVRVVVLEIEQGRESSPVPTS